MFSFSGQRYKAAMIEDVPRIFEAVFQCTLEVSTRTVNLCACLCGFYMLKFSVNASSFISLHLATAVED